MTSVRSIAAAVLLSALTTTPLFAQAGISEPATFQALNPYLDALNGGAPTPAYWLQGNPRGLQAYQERESGIHLQHVHQHS